MSHLWVPSDSTPDMCAIFSIASTRQRHLDQTTSTRWCQKKCAPGLSPVLRRLFHLSYSTGIVLSSWKNANVQPIPKKGDASMPNNYRLIFFVSVISKVMKTIINKQLLSHLERNSLLSDHQFGFCSERSNADLLCLVTDKMYQFLERHG